MAPPHPRCPSKDAFEVGRWLTDCLDGGDDVVVGEGAERWEVAVFSGGAETKCGGGESAVDLRTLAIFSPKKRWSPSASIDVYGGAHPRPMSLSVDCHRRRGVERSDWTFVWQKYSHFCHGTHVRRPVVVLRKERVHILRPATERHLYGGVHAFGYNSAESEPILMHLKHSEYIVGGWLWQILGRDPRKSNSWGARRNFVFFC